MSITIVLSKEKASMNLDKDALDWIFPPVEEKKTILVEGLLYSLKS